MISTLKITTLKTVDYTYTVNFLIMEYQRMSIFFVSEMFSF